MWIGGHVPRALLVSIVVLAIAVLAGIGPSRALADSHGEPGPVDPEPPAPDETATERSVPEEPVEDPADEPVSDQPTAEQPDSDESTAEQPAAPPDSEGTPTGAGAQSADNAPAAAEAEEALLAGDTYVVQPGDWVARIADENGVTVEDIVRLNPGVTAPDYFIHSGQVLVLREVPEAQAVAEPAPSESAADPLAEE